MMDRDRRRALGMLAYVAGLHLLVLVTLWRRSSSGVAPGVVLLSAIPIGLAVPYLLGRLVRPLGQLDLWVLLYALWSVGSGVLFLQTGNPTQPAAYFYGLYSFVLPIACYFAGRSLGRAQAPMVLSGIVLLNAFAVAYGLYMHFARPAYYADFLVRALTPDGATEEWQYYARLQSYLGSTLVGYISTSGIVLATMAVSSVKRALPALALLFTAGALLSLQRASLLALIVALAYLVFAARGNRGVRVLTVLAFVGAIIYGGAKAGAAADPIRERVQSRATGEILEGLERFFDERGYKPAIGYLRDFPMGVGLGGTASAADNAGLLTRPEVADANFMRIAADLGPVGLLLFLAVIGAAAGVAWRSEHRLAWSAYLVIHCGIMLSTNVLDSYYISQSFWLTLALLAADGDRGRAAPSATVPALAADPVPAVA